MGEDAINENEAKDKQKSHCGEYRPNVSDYGDCYCVGIDFF